jgi:hypothetical protein
MEIEKNQSRIISYETKLGSENFKARMIIGVVTFACVYGLFADNEEISSMAILPYTLFILIAYLFVNRGLRNFKRYESFIFISKAFLNDNKIENSQREIIVSSTIKIIDNAIIEKDKHYLNEKFLTNVNAPEPLTGLELSQYSIARLIRKEHVASAKLEYNCLDINYILLIQERSFNYEKKENESTLRSIRYAERESIKTGRSVDDFLTKRNEEFENSEKEKEKNKEEVKTKNTIRTIKLITGTCPHCLKKVPKLALKCPYCTVDF